MAKKKAGMPTASAAEQQSTASNSTLIICRNKHWRYISSFHGPWLHLPLEILESLAHQNWSMPSPRLIDPAIFFDVLKIRKYVDEAAYDAVRASTGISNTAMSGRMDYFGAGGGPGSQLSKERIFKIRQKAVALLSKAFTLDEVAASVATMQATSTVEDVGKLVLKREPGNNAAKYVHFFHEKVPSRAMEEHTSLQPLNDIITALPWEEQAAPLRTRALTLTFKQEYERAASDFTLALRIVEELKKIHKPNQQELELASKMRVRQEAWQKSFKDWRSIPQLKEEDQPKSLEMQLLFNRAGIYLTMACGSVHAALDGLKQYQAKEESGDLNDTDSTAQTVRLEARKRVKTNAKRALKDYMAFLSHFEYTPGLPYEITNEIMRRMHHLARNKKPPTASPTDLDARNGETTALIKAQSRSASSEKSEDGCWSRFPLPKIYSASMLFAERPPSDLPSIFANSPEAAPSAGLLKEAIGCREVVTYHPLLIEALHSLLLAHALLQTSGTEHQRHAYNVARLTRIADGYPIFQSSRAPARSDWQEIVAESKNWIGLQSSWSTLCAPVPLPDAAEGWTLSCGNEREVHRKKVEVTESSEQAQDRINHHAVIEALSDDRVVDEDTFAQAVRARQDRDTRRAAGESDKVLEDTASLLLSKSDMAEVLQSAPKKVDDDDAGYGNGYPISSARAQAIVRWIAEAPQSMGSKKKRPSRRKKRVDGSNVLTESVSTLSIDNDDEVD